MPWSSAGGESHHSCATRCSAGGRRSTWNLSMICANSTAIRTRLRGDLRASSPSALAKCWPGGSRTARLTWRASQPLGCRCRWLVVRRHRTRQNSRPAPAAARAEARRTSTPEPRAEPADGAAGAVRGALSMSAGEQQPGRVIGRTPGLGGGSGRRLVTCTLSGNSPRRPRPGPLPRPPLCSLVSHGPCSGSVGQCTPLRCPDVEAPRPSEQRRNRAAC